jgi:7-keto-8-aminopelargonate synthetase-like enzyme
MGMDPDRAAEPLAGRQVSGSASARWTIDGEEYLNFAGCGYLALAGLPQLRAAAYAALDQGAPFSRQMPVAYGGTDCPFDDVEAAVADAMGTEAAVYFASGYLIGMVGLAAFARPADHLFLDGGAHRNLVDAARLSGLPVTGFAHWRPDALADAVRRELAVGERPVVLTDGTSTATGELGPLDVFARLVEPFGGLLFVDDSHGFGVVGEHGRGAAEHLGVEFVAATATTLSKAYCASGAAIGGSRDVARRVHDSPPARHANPGSPVSAAVAVAAMRYMLAHPERRRQLRDLTCHLRGGLRERGVDVPDSPAPIVSFRVGDRPTMRNLQHELFARKIYLPISNYLGAGTAGLFRCAVFANHSIDDLDTLVDAVTR